MPIKPSFDPAPGCHGGNEGALWNGGRCGYSWSSATSDINGLDLYFGVGWLYPSSTYYRSYGFQLRCLSE